MILGQKYNITVNPYNSSQEIMRVERCFAYSFTNIGDTIARVNGQVIFPSLTPLTVLGDSRGVSGHEGDEYKGKIVLSFDVPLGVNPLIEIAQLYYVD